jgi:hypothetical protein
MQRIDMQAFEQALGAFAQQLGVGANVAFDGKTLCGSGQNERKPQHLMVAVTHGTPVALGQRAVGEKTNEIPEARQLLQPLDLRGRVVTGDAMHTQSALARFLVEEKGADYVLVFKDNQKTCHRLLAAMDWGLFPPLHRV